MDASTFHDTQTFLFRIVIDCGFFSCIANSILLVIPFFFELRGYFPILIKKRRTDHDWRI
jgi:hypothetical protein